MVARNFDSYSVQYSSYKENGVDRTIASIRCKDGDILVGVVYFHDIYPLPENNINNNIIKMNLHISRFNEVITFLRYEKPLQLAFESTRKISDIRTPGIEPVGEQE
jgi:hypothetical protein